MMGGTTGTRGFALVEAVIAGTLMLLLVQVAWWVAAVHGRVANRVMGEAAVLDGTRLVHHVLATEVAGGLESIDWDLSGDELELRALRGVAVGCISQEGAGWRVAVSGYRMPDPAKDSVLTFSEARGWQVSDLIRRTRAASPACHEIPGFSTEVWTLDPPISAAVVGVYFERGAYRFSAGAFRYRTGRGGWQPLTATGIDTDSTRLTPNADGGLGARVVWEEREVPAEPFSWTGWGVR